MLHTRLLRATVLWCCITLASCATPTHLSRYTPPAIKSLWEVLDRSAACSSTCTIDVPKAASGRKVVLIFAGLFGHKNSCRILGEHLTQKGYHCIFLSHQPLCNWSYYGILDDISLAISGKRLGWGSVASQAQQADERLHGTIGRQDEVYLLGHSQGGLVGIDFWDKYHKKYNIKGMAVLSAPLRGALALRNLARVPALLVAHRRALAAGWRAPNYISYALPYFIGVSTNALGLILLPGCADMRPGSSALYRLSKVYPKMKHVQLPVLAVMSHCTKYSRFPRTLYGKPAVDYLVSYDAPHDGLIATASQLPPMEWPQLEVMSVAARHSGVRDSQGPYSVYNHPKVIARITAFFDKLAYPNSPGR